MSFPALKNPADYERYKAIYLQTLQQQINNNATNYNANVLYLKTGQLPITPTDTRSIEDKFADTVGIQVQLRALVRQITDNDNTNDIMDDLIKDPPLMVFALQNFPTIKEHFSKTSAIGVQYPSFMSYVRQMLNGRQTTGTTTILTNVLDNSGMRSPPEDNPPDRPPTNRNRNAP